MAKNTIFILILGFITSLQGCVAQDDSNGLSWSETPTHAALLHGGEVLWQFNFDTSQDKPYFHPLRTPSGLEMTLERPADHPWHMGLWFSWKYLNGTNYWEEHNATGFSDGRSKILKVETRLSQNSYDADFTVWVAYSDSGQTVLTECRNIHVSEPFDGGYLITSHHAFKAETDVTLDLEKPAKHGGVQWGGYAGFSFRGSDQLQDPTFLASSGWTNRDDLTGYGEKERWMGIHASNTGEDVSLVIFDHPENPRHPSPWYVWYAEGHNLFFTPSLLFDVPLLLKKGQKLTLQYAVWVQDGHVEPTVVENKYSVYSKK